MENYPETLTINRLGLRGRINNGPAISDTFNATEDIIEAKMGNSHAHKCLTVNTYEGVFDSVAHLSVPRSLFIHHEAYLDEKISSYANIPDMPAKAADFLAAGNGHDEEDLCNLKDKESCCAPVEKSFHFLKLIKKQGSGNEAPIFNACESQANSNALLMNFS